MVFTEWCFPVEKQQRLTRRKKILRPKSSRLRSIYILLRKNYTSSKVIYCFAAIISFFAMLCSWLPLHVVLVELIAWVAITTFWLWLMDRGIFVHRLCGCSDHAAIAAVMLILILSIIAQFLLFYVVSRYLRLCVCVCVC